MDCQKFHHKISEQMQVILILKICCLTLKDEYVTLLNKHLDGGSEGPIGTLEEHKYMVYPFRLSSIQNKAEFQTQPQFLECKLICLKIQKLVHHLQNIS